MIFLQFISFSVGPKVQTALTKPFLTTRGQKMQLLNTVLIFLWYGPPDIRSENFILSTCVLSKSKISTPNAFSAATITIKAMT